MTQATLKILSQFEQETIRLAPIAIVVFDGENVIRIANVKARQLLQKRSNADVDTEPVGLPISELLPNLDLRQGESLQRLEIGRERSTFEVQCVKIKVDDCQWTALYFQSGSQREQLLEKEASTDELSGLANRRAFQRTMEGNCHRALSLAIIDIDRFKSVNDDHGHLIGDEVIRLTSKLMNKCFANHSILLSRMGGDEFSVLFDTSNAESVLELLNEFRQSVSLSQLPEFEGVQFSVSVGAVISTLPAVDSRTLLTLADRQLYVAKGNGRNQVAHVLLDESGTA